MTVPQSLLLAALAVAWIVLLVPSLTRRRGHVKETVEGSGFRVLTRTPATGRRSARRPVPTAAAQDRPRNVRSEDQMSSQQVDDSFRADDDTVVLDAVDDDRDAAVAESHGSHPFDEARDGAGAGWDDGADSEYDDAFTDDSDEAREEAAAYAEVAREDAVAYDDRDEAELRRQYQAWRATTRLETTGPSVAEAPVDEEAPEPANVRPIPRRPGRGVYDPEAAERARAYKFARRRRAVLVLTLLIVGFAVAAVLVSSTLWIGVGVSAVLLALFLTYLRRQVRIEADIRARRLAKLQRARQIRPEHAQAADESDASYAHRAPGSSQASGPVRQRSNRVVLDLDDDDPSFDDLEQYEPMEYRRAVGQ